MAGPDLTRRTLLGGLAAGTGAVALAGCGQGSTPAASSPTASGSPPPSSRSSSPSGGTSGAGAAGALVAAAEVPVGSGVILTADQLVVTQPKSGQFHAFSSICTHAGCPVAAVENNQILCPCHGSRYSAVDGSVLVGAVPGQAPLAETPVKVTAGEVVRRAG